ncbi:uncharacterized protein MCYG_01651 [Microsporum canis CBS 113480]|uniref:Uncharacterized protein n=1 Tax=Arthroderma otae (strain ATCC MYA-4605 / CBS 113480) TaxID=554155 RepID=C5FHB3_ARTOC|nr:uncharacterized protein MCYG_01651 [Microsporum canis CBS 113480]EEQ28832.1 predicted protein [Microsporum canis CBS 113480]
MEECHQSTFDPPLGCSALRPTEGANLDPRFMPSRWVGARYPCRRLIFTELYGIMSHVVYRLISHGYAHIYGGANNISLPSSARRKVIKYQPTTPPRLFSMTPYGANIVVGKLLIFCSDDRIYIVSDDGRLSLVDLRPFDTGKGARVLSTSGDRGDGPWLLPALSSLRYPNSHGLSIPGCWVLAVEKSILYRIHI